MKIRSDFVTNSSSVGYIVGIPISSYDWFEDYVEELDKRDEAQNEGVRTYDAFETLQELQTYVNGRPFDWASEPSGLQYNYMDEDAYLKCKEAIEAGFIVLEVSVDYAVCEEFADECQEYILEERY